MDDSTILLDEAKEGTSHAAAAAAVEKSPLYKPLRELTEDDIAQVTREDCRRFLKEKGMRRPSWNKSQAIQQVISLKALLEVRKEDGDDDDDENNNAGHASSSMKRQRDADDASSPGGENAHNPPLPPPPHPLSQQQKGAAERKRDFPSLPPPLLPVTSRETACMSTRDVSDPAMAKASAAEQMTVFYDGKVNVYDGVPPEKALMIMQLAASQSDYDGLPSSLVGLNRSYILPQLNPIQNITLHPPPPLTMVTTSQAKASMMPIRIPQYPQGRERKNLRELELEGPACRKALLQRYLEKRKDRYQSTNGQNYQCDIVSPHPMPPSTPTRSNSFKNIN